ncbi:hypothetical protein QTP70_020817 [Hemibagrus guttatus]|uniref:Uncharacterized protein n=1 Tax=Hemibagrus guttatus TaxID=175788 RepID=A0AAE0RHM3_9TELE|nr:hypothetical protein QTP70_020817 [Hemibagrus guttatus]
MCSFYWGTIESILTSCITVWFGGCTASCRKTLQCIVNAVSKIICVSLPSLVDIFHTCLTSRAIGIAADGPHPSNLHFSLLPSGRRAGSRGQQSKQGCPDLPLPRHFLQHFRRDPEAFPGQLRDIVSPACPGSSPGSLPGGACLDHLSRETSRRHPKQMPEPPQLPPFDVEEQRLYSELLPGDRAPYPISKGAPRHPMEEAHFGCLYLGSYLSVMTQSS